ncbi:uncharacterized protein TNCV_4777971 [Trichonephila clavipes]|nr:uncharacterized protein TNCV_4777971 [Trichonephila clavipes]
MASSQFRFLCKAASCVCTPEQTTKNGPLILIKRTRFLEQTAMGFCSLYESRFTMESDSGRLLIWRERSTRYHQSNTVERHSYRGGGIMVWSGW